MLSKLGIKIIKTIYRKAASSRLKVHSWELSLQTWNKTTVPLLFNLMLEVVQL